MWTNCNKKVEHKNFEKLSKENNARGKLVGEHSLLQVC